MAEGAMERVLTILKEEFDRQFKLINLRPIQYQVEKLTQPTWILKSKPLLNFWRIVALDSKEAHYLANLYGSNASKVSPLLIAWEQAPD